jgi:hypothetical protein
MCPALQNEDVGLLLYGLAGLGQPLPPSLLASLTGVAARGLGGTSGDGLGLLAWGAAQYGHNVPAW